MLEQLAHRREALTAGATHVGWKLGMGDRESIRGSIAVGYLTSATRLETGGVYRIDGLAAKLHADVELAVELGEDVDARAGSGAARAAVAAYAAALEIVDLAPVLDTPQAVVATNVFHRAVAFGAMHPTLPDDGVRAAARVNGKAREVGEVEADVADRLRDAARVLDAVGERLSRGDRIITGSIVQIPIGPGDDVEADLGVLGSARLKIVA